MKPAATKTELLHIPGILKMTAAVKDSKTAEAIAERRNYVAFWWDRRTKRLYAKEKALGDVTYGMV